MKDDRPRKCRSCGRWMRYYPRKGEAERQFFRDSANCVGCPARELGVRPRLKRSSTVKTARRDLASLAVGAVAGGALVGAGAALAHRDVKGRFFVLPPHHVPGMHVPRGGSSCANCTYVRERDDGPHCVEPGFVLWNRGTRLPVDDARDYCSDWWEPTAEARARIERTPGRRPGGRR